MGTATTPMDGEKPPVLLIAGPTASGKTDLAIKQALLLQGRGETVCVINADSAQVYADLQILSARPSPADMAGIPHVLFGTWDGAQACSAADWAAAAKQIITRLHASGSVPILVGGTGLYLKTLLEGIAPIPPIDPAIRSAVRALPPDEAYRALEAADPARAAALAPADRQRITRALEVVRSTGQTLSQWQERREGGIADQIALDPLILLPERERLYRRCDERFDGMMHDRGAIDEVERLLARGLSDDLPVMRAIGVPELRAAIEGRMTLAEAVAQAKQATRNYAKRQYTWFRRQTPPGWRRVEL